MIRLVNELAPKLEDDSGDVQSTDPWDVAEELGINIFDSIIYRLYELPFIKRVACKIESGSVLAFILEGLLKSVFQPRASFGEDCKTHYGIIKRAWEDIELTSLLLEEKSLWYIIDGYYEESNEQLLERLTPLIKGHLPMTEILPKSEEESETFIVRRALTILMGYLSAKDSILPFDDVMGREGFIGIRTFKYSDNPYDMKVEPLSSSGAFMEPSSCTLEALMPHSSLVTQLLHDSSFKDVTHQIESHPSSAKFAKFVLSYFASSFDKGCIPTYLRRGIFGFWRSSCLVPLRCALEKKSSKPSLFNIFKQLSDGAEMLRLKEQLSRIREDKFWKIIDIHKSSFSLKMRLALCTLIGYWSTLDMTKTVMLLHMCNNKKPLKDLKEVEIVSYWADQSHDLKGLKNVLAKEYQEKSDEVEHRIAEIERQQKIIALEAVERGYDNTSAMITAIMKDCRCIYIIFRWYFKTSGLLKKVVS
ncbi:hypothetical protein CASFOL_005380 [Castilleja foliolosa]|uniref:Uncharacterized protein n=1 Tax=Castilleja foliolosa TaxID=1961234 RepID=A0ABD3E4I5_9LAMI